MRAEEIMKRNLECIAPEQNVQAAAKMMRDKNIGFLPVCGADKKVLGTITDRDLAVRILADGKAATTGIRDVMSKEVISCKPGDDLQKAQDLMAKHHKSRIMCLDDNGVLVGVISLSDVAQLGNAAAASQLLQQVSEREARA
jgi:CBS domain-containing protein